MFDAVITSILRGMCPETFNPFSFATFVITSNCSGLSISYAFKKSTPFSISFFT